MRSLVVLKVYERSTFLRQKPVQNLCGIHVMDVKSVECSGRTQHVFFVVFCATVSQQTRTSQDQQIVCFYDSFSCSSHNKPDYE